MKIKSFHVSLVLIGLFVLAGVSRADVVAISSSTPTRIGRGDQTRKHMVLQNNTTNPVYLSFTTSSASVSAGFILQSSATTSGQQAVTLEDFGGNVYGLAAAGTAGEVRKLEVPR